MDTASISHRVEWAVAKRCLTGQEVSGDFHLVLPHSRGVLLAVIDGCGHGPGAARASELAVQTIRQLPESTVLSHIHRCHVALAESRGAVMTLADFDQHDQSLTLCGVGNVEAMIFRVGADGGSAPQEAALLRQGIVGAQMPTPFASVFSVHTGDVLIMASDGVRPDFGRELALRCSPQRLADHLMQQFYKGDDDALVLVARFRDRPDE